MFSSQAAEQDQVYLSQNIGRLTSRKRTRARGYEIDDLITIDVTQETLLQREKVNKSLSNLKSKFGIEAKPRENQTNQS